MVEELILSSRSYRRFDASFKITDEELTSLVDLGRLSPSGGNLQPLKYIISSDNEKNKKIFKTLKWAGYLKEWDGPKENERPTAYIIILGDTNICGNFGVDYGIAAHSILLGATELGLGGCMCGAINRKVLCESLDIPDEYEVLIVIALGKPVETVVVTDVKDNIQYYRDSNGTHYVPKRSLKDIII